MIHLPEDHKQLLQSGIQSWLPSMRMFIVTTLTRNIVLLHYSEALRSIKNEIDKLRDEFNSSQALSPDRESDPAEGVMPKHAYGSPMKGKWVYMYY